MCAIIISFILQVLALIVTIFGFIVSLPFQMFIREKPNVSLKKLEWYKWLKNPQFYLVIMLAQLLFLAIWYLPCKIYCFMTCHTGNLHICSSQTNYSHSTDLHSSVFSRNSEDDKGMMILPHSYLWL